MDDQLLVDLASALVMLWGVAHLIPTRSVVKGFGDISAENKLILTMEWITEGVAWYWLVSWPTVTVLDADSVVSRSVYVVCSAGLLVLAKVSLFTGFRVRFLPFRMCLFIFTGSTLLLLLGGKVL